VAAPHDGGVLITLADVYALVLELNRKLDALTGDQRMVVKTADDHTTKLADHDSRLRGLERGKWPVQSVSVLVAIAALVVSVVVSTQK